MDLRTYLEHTEVDKIFAIIAIIFSIVVIGFFIDKVIYAFTGFLILIFCTIWLLIRNKATLGLDLPLLNLINIKLSSLFFVIFTLSVLSLYLRPMLYERPLIYYMLVSIMVGIVALEIIYSQKKTCYSILFQIIVIGISIAWSQLLIFPSLLGVDPWYHQALTLEIISSDFIPIGYGYSKLPFFHLLVASTSLITGLDYKYSTMLSASFAQIVVNCLFIFLLGKFVLNDFKVGLLASLFLIISNHHIFMSYWSIPNSLAAIFIPIIFYILFRMKNEMQIRGKILVIFLIIPLILTHTITALCMTIILFVYWLAPIFYNIFSQTKQSISGINYPVLFTISMFSWWTFASGHLRRLADLIKWGFSIDYFSNNPTYLSDRAGITILNNPTIIESFIEVLGTYLFFALSLIGLLYMISKKGNYLTFNIAIIGSVPLIIAFSSVIIQYGIIAMRWIYFAQIFLSIPLAIAIILICNSVKNSSFKPIFLIFISMTLVLLMIISPMGGVDTQMFSPNISARAALTSAELQSIQRVSTFWDGSIMTDVYFARSQSFEYNTEPFDKIIYDENYDLFEGNMTLVRDEIIHKPFKIFSSLAIIDYDLKDVLVQNGHSKIYDSRQVSAFLKF